MALLRLVKTYQKILVALFGILFIIVGTLAALRWAKGYRFNFGEKGPELTGTGLLVASSDPKGAQVYLNGKLTTATDDTLNLPPGSYQVEIKKDGFLPWKKKLEVVTELVTQTTAKLFPSVPNLTPLTFTGAKDPYPSPDGQKIVYRVDSAANEAKNGLWILELSERSFAVARIGEPKQIARTTSQYDFSAAKIVWTPDSNQILAYWQDEGRRTRAEGRRPTIAAAVLLGTSGMNDEADLVDATPRLPVLLSQWYQDLDEKDMVRLKELPKLMQETATASAQAAYFSPDEKRLLYSPSENLTIPEGLTPDLPAESTQPEERDIKVDSLYVYDIEEDRNYRLSVLGFRLSDLGRSVSRLQAPGAPATGGQVGSSVSETGKLKTDNGEDYWRRRLEDDRTRWEAATESAEKKKTLALPPVPEELLPDLLADLPNRYSPIWQLGIQWFPTSAHLLTSGKDGISIVEYDGANNSVVYSGPSQDNFVYPWPNGSRLVILTNFNDQNSPTNLYAINLK